MLYNAKNGILKIGNTEIDYVSFGKGDKNLVIVPGLGDGLKTVKGMATIFSVMYKCFASDYRVYILSRKKHLKIGCSTREMAADNKIALDLLSISKADIIGISQGGMIAQYIAIDYPEIVGKLILAVTLSKQNDTVQEVIAFNPAVELSYLSQKEQTAVATAMEEYAAKPSLSQAVRLKNMKKAGTLTIETIGKMLAEAKKPPKSEQTGSLRFRKYFPLDYSPKQMETVIVELLTDWKARAAV